MEVKIVQKNVHGNNIYDGKKKLKKAEVCELMDRFEDWLIERKFPSQYIYEIAKYLPLFLKENEYEIWKKI